MLFSFVGFSFSLLLFVHSFRFPFRFSPFPRSRLPELRTKLVPMLRCVSEHEFEKMNKVNIKWIWVRLRVRHITHQHHSLVDSTYCFTCRIIYWQEKRKLCISCGRVCERECLCVQRPFIHNKSVLSFSVLCKRKDFFLVFANFFFSTLNAAFLWSTSFFCVRSSLSQNIFIDLKVIMYACAFQRYSYFELRSWHRFDSKKKGKIGFISPPPPVFGEVGCYRIKTNRLQFYLKVSTEKRERRRVSKIQTIIGFIDVVGLKGNIERQIQISIIKSKQTNKPLPSVDTSMEANIQRQLPSSMRIKSEKERKKARII